METIEEYIKKTFIHDVGESWFFSTNDIKTENYVRITDLSRESVQRVLGFEVAHVGINMNGEEDSVNTATMLHDMFSTFQ